MFGILRTTLALMVMVYHLFAGVLPLGTYAVFGFYIISGYLMTLIMNTSYGHTWFGRYSFGVNRFLRLYPQYWAAVIFSILLIYFLGSEVTTNYHASIFIPTSLEGVLHNFLMAFPSWHPNSINPRLVPPTWALTVEIFFYILICFGISKTFKRVKIWLLLSVCYVVGSYVAGLPWQDRYFPVAAASLPFSIGSAIFFVSKSNHMQELYFKLKVSSIHLFSLMLINCLVWMILSSLNIGKLVEIGLYINILICSLLVYSIVIGGEILKINRKADKLIGDFSYPIYLLHWQSGLLVSFLIFGEPFHELSARGLISLVGSILFVIIFSLLFIWSIDKPIQLIRSKVKANKALQRTLVPRTAEL